MMRAIIFLGLKLISYLKILIIITLAFLLPRILLSKIPINIKNNPKKITKITIDNNYKVIESLDKNYKLGLENITLPKYRYLKSKNIALITNITGVTQEGQRNIDFLLNNHIKIKKVYTPEHGLTGQELAEKKVGNTIDYKTKVPVLSLYGGDSRFNKPEKKDLNRIKYLVFDMQDSGMRHYTYISILYKMLELAGEYNKKFIVLDRPNPLGLIMEGPLVNTGLESFISIANIPLRHGMTIGELAKYFNKEILSKKVNLTIIPMTDYSRDMNLNNKLLRLLSPNLASIQSLWGYSFTGILGEISPVNIAIGSKDAFRCVLLPDDLKISKNKWQELALGLRKNNISSKFFKYLDKRKKKNYSGLRLYIKDINKVLGFKCLINIIKFLKKLKLENKDLKFIFGPAFNKAVGTDKFKLWINNEFNLKELNKKINQDLKEFKKRATNSFIYRPLPKLVLI